MEVQPRILRFLEVIFPLSFLHGGRRVIGYDDESLFCGNLWSIKKILRGFELVSGLRINLCKSRFVGINLDPDFVQAAKTFLKCEIRAPTFNFLGIPVGINPRRKKVWHPIFSKMKKRLSTWKNKNISIGGRVVILNAILSNILIFYFSFFKALKAIIKEIIKIQKNFIWGGREEKKKID
ncbi:hypothetical protein KIW84_040626 [Lathyrus oleraceus]|uniref:Uncharacterized protein n=1 Tax=Pisum sativum TaxID=3888 RepID=A0A9D4X804_PEA|nr:hypothetical protein KIW84_040626 [Pisum sativum]